MGLPLSAAIERFPEHVEALGQIAPVDEAHGRLNGAEMDDALVVIAPRNLVSGSLLRWCVAVPGAGTAHPHLLVVAETSSQLTVIERL